MLTFLKKIFGYRPRFYSTRLQEEYDDIVAEVKKILDKYRYCLCYNGYTRIWSFACPYCKGHRLITMDNMEDAALSRKNPDIIDIECPLCEKKIDLTLEDFNHFREVRKRQAQVGGELEMVLKYRMILEDIKIGDPYVSPYRSRLC